MDVLSKFRLDNKIAIVTGGGRGIGRAIALFYAQAGADVVIADIDRSAGDAVAQEIEELGRKNLSVPTDVGRDDHVSRLVETTVKRFGRIDILVNNAGVFNAMTPAVSLSEAEWDRVTGICLKGVFLVSRAVGKVMIAQQAGNIVNIASGSGTRAVPGFSVYAAAKAGVINFTETLSIELARYHIRVNCIIPGAIDTGLGASRGSARERVERAGIPLGRIGSPEDVAYAAIYLASDASDWVTGTCIEVKGGPYTRKGDTEAFLAKFP